MLHAISGWLEVEGYQLLVNPSYDEQVGEIYLVDSRLASLHMMLQV